MQIDAPALVAAVCGLAVMVAIVGADAATPESEDVGAVDGAVLAEAAFRGSAAGVEGGVWVVDADTGEVKAAPDADRALPALSSDGAAVVFVTRGGRPESAYVFDFETGEARPLLAD